MESELKATMSGRILTNVLGGFLAAVALMPDMSARETLEARFDPASQRLQIEVKELADRGYELRIVTPGVRDIETGAEVNEPGIIYLPPREGPLTLTARPPTDPRAEIVFFFNDLVTAANWECVAEFPEPGEAGAGWKLNGRFSPLGGALQSRIAFPVSALEPGENLLYFRAEKPAVPKLYFRQAIATAARSFFDVIRVGRRNWSGEVLLLARDGEASGAREIARVTITEPASDGRPTTWGDTWWNERAALRDAALAVGRNLVHAQVRDPGSFFHGGFHLVYDVPHRTYRMPHWIWSWGPSIALLLKLQHLPEARAAGLAGEFREVALAAAERSLAFETVGAAHPARGVPTVRWEPSRAVPGGWVEYISTADSLFLAGWGWMSAYRESGRAEFLERTRSLVAAAERLMGEYPVIPQDWVVQRERWTPHTLDESVFGMIGFRELHAATKSADVAAAGRRFLDSHLKHMGRESGLLERAWLREEDRAIWDPDIKGHAWVVEGYLDAYQLSGDTRYLELARALAGRVIECQHEDGSWTYLFKRPAEGDPRDDKGTAIWAYFFYELHRVTKDPAHLAAARRALGWCLRHQFRGDDPQLDGGILNTNSMAYVRRRPMTILYSTTFFGLALLEELALAER